MVLEVLADVGQVDYWGYADALEIRLVANAREKQNLRRADRAGGEDNLLLDADCEPFAYKICDSALQ